MILRITYQELGKQTAEFSESSPSIKVVHQPSIGIILKSWLVFRCLLRINKQGVRCEEEGAWTLSGTLRRTEATKSGRSGVSTPRFVTVTLNTPRQAMSRQVGVLPLYQINQKSQEMFGAQCFVLIPVCNSFPDFLQQQERKGQLSQ